MLGYKEAKKYTVKGINILNDYPLGDKRNIESPEVAVWNIYMIKFREVFTIFFACNDYRTYPYRPRELYFE